MIFGATMSLSCAVLANSYMYILQVVPGLKVRIDRGRLGDWSHSAAVQRELIRRSREGHCHEVPEPKSGGA